MIRKADGTGFERDFRDEMEKYAYVLRLPTLNTGNAGSTQPADFIVVNNSFNLVELKETAQDSFSVSSMSQLEEVIEHKKRIVYYQGKTIVSSSYVLIVHFFKYKVYKVIRTEKILEYYANRKTVKPTDDVETYYSLKQLCKEIDL